MDAFKQVATTAAREAGQKLLKTFQSKINFSAKNAYDVLTEGDLFSEKIILNTIQKKFPDHQILSEEVGLVNDKHDFLWVIDPLDGSINFSRKIEDFCISIGLVYKNKRILGVIYHPFHDIIYVAEKGKGSYKNGKRIYVSKEKKLIDCLISTDWSSKMDSRKSNLKLLSSFCFDVKNVKILGSGALQLANIAEGKIDLYFLSSSHYWDHAAGAILIEEAGGKVSDFSGKKFDEYSENIMASNKTIHPQALKYTTH